MAKKTTKKNLTKAASGSKGPVKASAKPATKAAGKGSKSSKATGKGAAKGAAKGAVGGKKPPMAKAVRNSTNAATGKARRKGAVLPVGSGSGPSPAEMGRDFVALFNARTPDHEIWDKLFSPDFVSVEGHGASMAFHGRDAVQAKCDQWLEMSTVHGCACEGPFVGATCFAVKFQIDKTDKATGRREVNEEIAIYTVQDGRVVREEFCYFMA